MTVTLYLLIARVEIPLHRLYRENLRHSDHKNFVNEVALRVAELSD